MRKKVKKILAELIFSCLLGTLFLVLCCQESDTDGDVNYYDPFDDPYDPNDKDNIPASLPIQRISLSVSGAEGNGHSFLAVPNRNGRYFAFYSKASNLVNNDTNRSMDIFVYDRQKNNLLCISRFNSQSQGNGQNLNPAMSEDGRLIAYQSNARNIVPGYTNIYYQIIVYNREMKKCERVSGYTEAAQGNNDSYKPAISANNKYIGFESKASNLVINDNNAKSDIFVFDRETNQIERVNLTYDGGEANDDSFEVSISGDGQFVTFDSLASNLILYDTNNKTDVFIIDRKSDTKEPVRISVGSKGEEGNDDSSISSLSDDGHYIVFESVASNLVPNGNDKNEKKDIFLYDRITKIQKRISVNNKGEEANGESSSASISADGRYITFHSTASNLIEGDTNDQLDVFVYDRITDTLKLISKNADRVHGDNTSSNATVTADGRYIVFDSSASNLVTGDTNGFFDIFVAPNE